MRSLSPPSSALWQGSLETGARVACAERESSWAELFIAIQLLWALPLFLPGMQPYRGYIRALPYLVSLAALVYHLQRGSREPAHDSSKWLIAVFALLALNLLHETTHLLAGIGQIVFQLSIAAPAFWMASSVRSEARLERVVWVLFGASLIGSALGVLQVYYPERFLPPEFSSLSRSLNPEIVAALTYVGADGREIVRPPGLSDLPGGAAASGMMTMILGLALAMRRQHRIVSLACLASAVVGMTALYLTQVRALSVVAAGSVALFALVRFRQGRAFDGAAIVAVGVTLVVGAYAWAVGVGGDALASRFGGLIDDGVLQTFEDHRGQFLRYTLTDLLYEYPFGAGLGRWGTMHVYFGDPTLWQAPAIHAEIQATGWLLDGGIPMWFLYGGALVTAVWFSYLVSVRAASESLRDNATVLFCIQLTIIGLSFAGPVFNTQLGIVFWALTGALFGSLMQPGDGSSETTEREAPHE